MKQDHLPRKKIAPVIAAVLLVVLGLGVVGFGLWLNAQPKFQDVTVELGTQQVTIDQFLTKFAQPARVTAAQDLATLDLSAVGTQTLTFSHNGKAETVTLTVADRTPPDVTFRDVTACLGQNPSPEDFIESCSDLSGVTVTFQEEPALTVDYSDTYVVVLVTDDSGNTVSGRCVLSWNWMRTEVALELGDTLTKGDILLDPEKDGILLDQGALDAINGSPIGQYSITTISGGRELTCFVTVRDTMGPVLEVQNVKIMKGNRVTVEDFILSSSDVSGAVTVAFVQEPLWDQIGPQKVTIEATDIYGNKTVVEAELLIQGDGEPPVFSGMGELVVKKGTTPNYTYGVRAKDSKDGYVKFAYDASGVDINKPGTYYVIYTATDSSGNTVTFKRKVTVKNDASDTAALVASIANRLSNDPEKIRDYVRSSIMYTSHWGGEDPVYFGFTKKHGNCYVHALCLQVLLDYKGYETQLIWVTAPDVAVKSHYWVLIKLDGRWWHIDATPGPVHSKYSLMNDAQRYETLVRDIDGEEVQRDWDRSKWPACP